MVAVANGRRVRPALPAVSRVVRAGLITAAALGVIGRRVAAVLTPAGHQALDAYTLTA